MNFHTPLVSVALLGLLFVNQAVAQPRDAASKARGNTYQFWVGQSAQTHARNGARSLYYYGQAPDVVTPAQAQHHVQEVRQGLATSQHALNELKRGNADNPEVLASIAKLEALHKKVLGHCGVVDEHLAKSDVDHAELCECCLDMHADLEAADAEMQRLMKALKIEKLPIPTREKPATDPARK